MGIHHIAIATRDIDKNHAFYTEAMGFELVKVVVGRNGHGFSKHLFYDTGSTEDGIIAFWDLHDDRLADDWSADISRGLGLPIGINHIAFTASDLDDIARRRDRWLERGYDVREIDHGWCHSIYNVDPNGIVVEFCVLTRELDENDRREARELLANPNPPASTEGGDAILHKAADTAAGAMGSESLRRSR